MSDKFFFMQVASLIALISCGYFVHIHNHALAILAGGAFFLALANWIVDEIRALKKTNKDDDQDSDENDGKYEF